MFTPSSSAGRLLGVAVAAMCAAFAARAEEFSWQLSGVVRQADTGNFDAHGWAVDATYYVNPVADGDGPFALASFLNPTTRVSAAANRSDSPDPTAYTLGGAYVLPGRQWYVGADYAKADADGAPPVTRSDPKGYGVRAGRYLGANTTLELGFGRSEQESSVACLPGPQVCPGLSLETEVTTNAVGLEVFHVRRFRSLTYALQGGVSERETDVEIRSPINLPGLPAATDVPLRTYSVAAELFPRQTFGVRIGYSRPDGDFDLESYDVAATWFFKPRVAVQLALSRATLDDAPPGLGRSDTAGVRFIGRL